MVSDGLMTLKFDLMSDHELPRVEKGSHPLNVSPSRPLLNSWYAYAIAHRRTMLHKHGVRILCPKSVKLHCRAT